MLLELREGGREVRKRGRIRDMEQEVCVCGGGGVKARQVRDNEAEVQEGRK